MDTFEDIYSFFPATFEPTLNEYCSFEDAFGDVSGPRASNLQKPNLPTDVKMKNIQVKQEYQIKQEFPVKQEYELSHTLDSFVSLKPAKGRETEFKFAFPKEMNTTPYKYDMRIAKDLNIKSLKVKLVYEDGEDLPYVPFDANYQLPSNYRTKAPLEVNETTSKSYKEHIIRFSLNVCSFHHRRRKFCVSVSDGDRELFRSTPFKTFARRKSSSKASSTRQLAQAIVNYSPGQTPVVAQKRSNNSFQVSMNTNHFANHQFKTMPAEERTVFVGKLLMSLSPVEQQAVFKYIKSAA